MKEKLSPGDIGTISELLAANFFLEKGYSVFRSLSPNASCDLIILKEGKPLRVEVKTIRSSLFAKHIPKHYNFNKFDILATVDRGKVEILTQEEYHKHTLRKGKCSIKGCEADAEYKGICHFHFHNLK